MRDGVIFEMTKDHLHRNLHQVPVGYCHTSFLHPENGIYYSMKSLAEVASWDVCKVMYLLLKGISPTQLQLQAFKEELQTLGKLQEATVEKILKLPLELSVMNMLSMALELVYTYEKIESPISLIAKLSHIFSSVMIRHANMGEAMIYDGSIDYMNNFVQMLKQKSSVEEALLPILDLLFISYMDHGGGALDAFVAKVAFSSKQSYTTSLLAALHAYDGDLLGRASSCAYLQLKEVYGQIQGEIEEEKLQAHFSSLLQKKEKIYGFGHPVFSIEDPRATLLYNYAKKHFPSHPFIKTALACRAIVPQLLEAKTKRPYANGYAIVGPLLGAAGFDHEEYFPLLLFMARSIGILIQLQHEQEKKNKLFSPTYLYRAKI